MRIYRKNGEVQHYAYDVNGNRVRKLVVGGSDNFYINAPDGNTEAVSLTPNGCNFTYNLRGAGGLIGQVRVTGKTNRMRYFYLKDHLGSIRVTVDSTGVVAGYDYYYAFGMSMRGYVSQADARYRFTGRERDMETGYDYFGARGTMTPGLAGG